MKKAAVVFYSYSGNTKKLATMLKEKLSAVYQTDIVEIEALDEPDSFLRQCLRSLKKKQAQIKENLSFDLKEYDLIALGTPVWAFSMAPALRTFIRKYNNLNEKDIIVFATYGSGVGKDKCINEMEDICKDNGAKSVRKFLVQMNDLKDENKVESILKEIKI